MENHTSLDRTVVLAELIEHDQRVVTPAKFRRARRERQTFSHSGVTELIFGNLITFVGKPRPTGKLL